MPHKARQKLCLLHYTLQFQPEIFLVSFRTSGIAIAMIETHKLLKNKNAITLKFSKLIDFIF